MPRKKDIKKMEKEIKIQKIRDGIVIDHITKGKALDVVKVLDLDYHKKTDHQITLAMNLESNKYGAKDVIKIENKNIKKEELDKIAIISPQASVCIVKDYKVIKKIRISIPKMIENVIKCGNPKCITNNEEVITRFITQQKEPLKVKCFFCEKIFLGDEIKVL